MATYTLSRAISPADLAESDDPDALITRTEAAVIEQLGGQREAPGPTGDTTGDTMIGWMARVGELSGSAHSEWIPWDPHTEAVPDSAGELLCKGRRLA